MLKPIVLSALTACFFTACTGKQTEILPGSATSAENQNNPTDSVFQWQIHKKSLGPITVGQHIKDLKNVLGGLDSTAVDVNFYKYDGGGKAYEYRKNGTLLFALMPAMDTDSIIAIMAVHPAFVTENGLHSGSTAAEVAQNKKVSVYMDLESGGEVIIDANQGVNFIFDTPEDSPLAEYPDVDSPGVIKHSEIRCNWITIF